MRLNERFSSTGRSFSVLAETDCDASPAVSLKEMYSSQRRSSSSNLLNLNHINRKANPSLVCPLLFWDCFVIFVRFPSPLQIPSYIIYFRLAARIFYMHHPTERLG